MANILQLGARVARVVRVASLTWWPQVTGSEARLRLRHSLGQSVTVASLPKGCSFTLYTGRGFKVRNILYLSVSGSLLTPPSLPQGTSQMLTADAEVTLHRVKSVRLSCDV